MGFFDGVSDAAKEAAEKWAAEFDKSWLGLVNSIRNKPRLWVLSSFGAGVAVGVILRIFV